MCMGVLIACTSVFAWFLRRQEEGVRAPENAVTNCYKLPCSAWKIEHRSTGRATRTFNCWAISSPYKFLKQGSHLNLFTCSTLCWAIMRTSSISCTAIYLQQLQQCLTVTGKHSCTNTNQQSHFLEKQNESF